MAALNAQIRNGYTVAVTQTGFVASAFKRSSFMLLPITALASVLRACVKNTGAASTVESEQTGQLKNIIFLGGSLISAFAVSACYMPVVDNKDVKRAQKSAPIPYKQLVTETSHPSSVENPAPGYPKPEKNAAVNKFPTTRGCLIESEQKAETPDLRLIDWKTIRTRSELNVCLTRIFKSLDDFQSIKSWWAFHHLNTPPGNPEQKFASTKFLDGTIMQFTTLEWRGRLPFHDASPVPRIVGGPYKVTVWFNSSNGKRTSVSSVSSDWDRQM